MTAALLITGCAYRTPNVALPPEVPSVEEAAVSVEGADDLDPDTVSDLESKTRQLLARASRRRAPDSRHARVCVHVVVEKDVDALSNAMHTDGMAAMAVPALLLGTTFQWAHVDVELAIETDDGRVLYGRGEAEKNGSLYAAARKRALAVALDRAGDGPQEVRRDVQAVLRLRELVGSPALIKDRRKVDVGHAPLAAGAHVEVVVLARGHERRIEAA
ncbi:MAG TPA: hypothetical protein VIF62_18895, partial [Labilithrix sp.]